MARRSRIPVPPGYTLESWTAIRAGAAAYQRARRAGRVATPEEKAAEAEYVRSCQLDPQALLGKMRTSARRRALGQGSYHGPCAYDPAALPAFIPTHCPLTGLPISLAKPRKGRSGGPRRPSLDKTDPALGYAFAPDGISNVRVVSRFANMAKGRLTDDEFRGFCLATVLTAYRSGWTPADCPIRLRAALLRLQNSL